MGSRNQNSLGLPSDSRRLRDQLCQVLLEEDRADHGGICEDDQAEEGVAEIPGETPNLGLPKGSPLEPLSKKKLRRQLKPLFETRVQRTVYPVRDNGHAIAFTVDWGRIESGKRTIPLCEIELELQRRNPGDLFDIARAIAQRLPASLGVKSKSERGYELLDKKEDAPAKACQVHLGPQ
jgi:triphosphatase